MSAFFLIVNALFCHFLALKQAPLLAFALCLMELPCVNEWCAVTNGFKYDDEDDVHGNCAAHDPKYKQQHIDLATMKSRQLGMDAEDLSAKLMRDDVQIIQPFPQLFLGVSLMRLLVDLGPGVPPNLTNLIAGLESHSFTTTSAGRPSVDLAQGEPVGMPELVAIFYVRQFPFAALHIAKLNLAAITKYTVLCLAAVGVALEASDVELIRNLTADCCELLVPLTTKEEALELVRNSEKRGVVGMLIGKYNTLGSDADAVSLWDKDKMSTHKQCAARAWEACFVCSVALHVAVWGVLLLQLSAVLEASECDRDAPAGAGAWKEPVRLVVIGQCVLFSCFALVPVIQRIALLLGQADADETLVYGSMAYAVLSVAAKGLLGGSYISFAFFFPLRRLVNAIFQRDF
jgi:hypothetical protein